MAIKKAAQKPRSPTTGKVFEAFVAELRADSEISDAVAERIEAALLPGQTINAANFHSALFPAKESDTD